MINTAELTANAEIALKNWTGIDKEFAKPDRAAAANKNGEKRQDYWHNYDKQGAYRIKCQSFAKI